MPLRHSRTDIYDTRILRRECIAENVTVLACARPAEYTYNAGGYALFELPEDQSDDEAGRARYLSFVSAPDEGDLCIAFRAGDTAFKRYLQGAPLGAPLLLGASKNRLAGMAGEEIVCIAGGIGIVPFVSIVRDACTRDDRVSEMSIIYSARTPAEATSLDELLAHQVAHPWFHLTPIFTRSAVGARSNRIDESLLSEHLSPHARYLIAGEPGMVQTVRELLSALQVSSDRILTEEFCGYGGSCCPHCRACYRRQVVRQKE